MIPVGLGDIDIVIDITGSDADVLASLRFAEVILVGPAPEYQVTKYETSPGTTAPSDGTPTHWTEPLTTVFGVEDRTYVAFRHTFDIRGEWRLGLRLHHGAALVITSKESIRIGSGDGLLDWQTEAL